MAMVKVVEKLGMVMQLSTTVGSMTAGPLLGMFTMGMTMPFMRTESVLAGCTTAALTMAYIVVRAQIDSATGMLRFPTKPVSVEGCTYEFDMSPLISATLNNSNTADAAAATAPRAFHHISFLWYTGMGASITIIIALLATLYFGQQESSEVNPNLIIPKLRKYMKKYKYSSVPQQMDKLVKECNGKMDSDSAKDVVRE